MLTLNYLFKVKFNSKINLLFILPIVSYYNARCNNSAKNQTILLFLSVSFIFIFIIKLNFQGSLMFSNAVIHNKKKLNFQSPVMPLYRKASDNLYKSVTN